MTPELHIDMQQWRAAANDLFRTSSRSCVDFINGQALKVAIEAIRNTQKADRAGIRAELSRIERGSSLAQKILGARFRHTHEWGVHGSTIAERVQRYIGGKVRSGAFIAAGWIPARRRLFSLVRQRPQGASSSFAGSHQYGRDKGSVNPAVWGGLRSLIFADITNTALLSKSKDPSRPRDPRPVAIRGLQAALRIARQDMIETLAKRLQKDLAPFNARK